MFWDNWFRFLETDFFQKLKGPTQHLPHRNPKSTSNTFSLPPSSSNPYKLEENCEPLSDNAFENF